MPAEDQAAVLNSPWLRRQIEARRKDFQTSKLLVKGVSFVGEGEKRQLLKVDARVEYKNPDGKDASYHCSLLPDAGSLLVVFRIASEQVTIPQKNNPHSFSDYHVLLIEQPRWAVNAVNCLETPGGLLTGDEGVDVESIKKGILREAFEESGEAFREMIEVVGAHEQISLGAPLSLHPAVSDKQHEFYVVLDVTLQHLEKIKEAIQGTVAGLAKEGEATRPVIFRL